jgi:hypothetical protein
VGDRVGVRVPVGVTDGVRDTDGDGRIREASYGATAMPRKAVPDTAVTKRAQTPELVLNRQIAAGPDK